MIASNLAGISISALITGESKLQHESVGGLVWLLVLCFTTNKYGNPTEKGSSIWWKMNAMQLHHLRNTLANKAHWISSDGFIILLLPEWLVWQILAAYSKFSSSRFSCPRSACSVAKWLRLCPASLQPCHLLWRTYCLHILSHLLKLHAASFPASYCSLSEGFWRPFSLCSSAFWGSRYLAFSNFSFDRK